MFPRSAKAERDLRDAQRADGREPIMRGATIYYKCPWCGSGLNIRKVRNVERHSRNCAKRPKLEPAVEEATRSPRPLLREFLSLLRRAPLPPQVLKPPKV